jgi:16S rRNA C967 or C1407 C5-methylase (RsmB/RsmF family)
VTRVMAGPDRAVPASLLDPSRTELVIDPAAAPA